ncbi:hypothetical protein Ancab_024527 [Ancistrocladus abbreviatus]
MELQEWRIKVAEQVFLVRVYEESFCDGNFWMQSDYACKPLEVACSSSSVSADCCPSSSAAMIARKQKEENGRLDVRTIRNNDPTGDGVTGLVAEKISEGIGRLERRTEHTTGAFIGSVSKVILDIADRGKERSGAVNFQMKETEGQNHKLGNNRGQRSNSWLGRGGNGPINDENGPNFIQG